MFGACLEVERSAPQRDWHCVTLFSGLFGRREVNTVWRAYIIFEVFCWYTERLGSGSNHL